MPESNTAQMCFIPVWHIPLYPKWFIHGPWPLLTISGSPLLYSTPFLLLPQSTEDNLWQSHATLETNRVPLLRPTCHRVHLCLATMGPVNCHTELPQYLGSSIVTVTCGTAQMFLSALDLLFLKSKRACYLLDHRAREEFVNNWASDNILKSDLLYKIAFYS